MTRLIDADAFIEENQEIIDCEIDHPKYQDTIRELIDQAPTIKTFTLADIEEQYQKGLEKGLEEVRPHGKWIISEVCCPYCLEYFDTDCYTEEELNRCPNCGAVMRPKEGDEK